VSIHEHLQEEEPQAGPSNRSFGLTVGGILLAIAGYRIYAGGLDTINWILLAAGGPLVLLGTIAPSVLTVPNRLWMGLGRVLFLLVNPVVMLLMYGVCIVPVGLVLRLVGYDPLRRRFDPSSASYWIDRTPNETDDPMKHQF